MRLKSLPVPSNDSARLLTQSGSIRSGIDSRCVCQPLNSRRAARCSLTCHLHRVSASVVRHEQNHAPQIVALTRIFTAEEQLRISILIGINQLGVPTRMTKPISVERTLRS